MVRRGSVLKDLVRSSLSLSDNDTDGIRFCLRDLRVPLSALVERSLSPAE